jgi:hypothetical protein
MQAPLVFTPAPLPPSASIGGSKYFNQEESKQGTGQVICGTSHFRAGRFVQTHIHSSGTTPASPATSSFQQLRQTTESNADNWEIFWDDRPLTNVTLNNFEIVGPLQK